MDNLTEQLMKYSCKDCDSSGCCAWKQRVVDGDKCCQRPKTFAEDMLRILESNNYIQLQAGEDGLLADEEIQELYDSDDYGDGFALWEEIAIRQKALDESQAKQKQAEAVKKVFDWFLSRSYPEDDVIEITFSKTELDTFKQTLEEL